MSDQPKIVSIPEVELDAKDARIAELERVLREARKYLPTDLSCRAAAAIDRVLEGTE